MSARSIRQRARMDVIGVLEAQLGTEGDLLCCIEDIEEPELSIWFDEVRRIIARIERTVR